MMSTNFCKGGCGKQASRKGWCKLKWEKGKRFAVACPSIEEKRGKSISQFRIEEAKQGRNPMQNPEICRKNHSPARNKKAAEALKSLGRLGLLPQQVEDDELKERRRIRNQRALQKLWREKKHPIQLKSEEEKLIINKKIARTLDSLAALGQHPSQLWSEETRRNMARKSSKRMKEMIKSGKTEFLPGWKKVPYKNELFRSYWEKLTAQFLDKHNIKWEYETLIIPYYDTTRSMVANTIPDFHLPEYNTIIEVKGNGRLNWAQTKDKMDAIRGLGYNTFLFGNKQIKLIKEGGLSIIRTIKNEKS